MTWHVAMKSSKRRVLPATPLDQLPEEIEHAKVSIWAKVEHPFHVVKNLFTHRKTRYRSLAKNLAQLLTLFGMANLMLVQQTLAGNSCPRCVPSRTKRQISLKKPFGPKKNWPSMEPVSHYSSSERAFFQNEYYSAASLG